MKITMYLQEHCWYLLLMVLIVSFNDVSGCSCNPSSHININAVNLVGSGLSSIRNKLGTASSKQLCVPYSMRSFLGWSWPVFDTNDINSAIVRQSCSPSNSDGSIDCLIQDPYFSLSDQCYPPKYFCIHQVMCPLNHVATIHCSSVGLPENNGNCLDAVHINSGRVRGKQVCGTTYSNCFPDINEAGGSLIQITFTSGQCCQHCGYRFWVRCVPHTGYSKRSLRKPVELEEEENFEGPLLPIKKTFKSVVPFGAVLTYANGTLTVKLGTLKLQERKTPKLQVRDDIAYPGVLFEAMTTANRSFVGYGIMTIYPDRIHYYQQGIPPQEEPNSTEKEFIKTVISSIKSKVKSFIVVNKSFQTARRGPSGPGASSCQCSKFRPPPSIAPPGVARPPGPLGPPGGSHFLKDARYYAKYSNKPTVKYWAKLYLKYYDTKPAATPGPPTQGPTTASTAPPTRGPPSIAPPTEGSPVSPGPIKPGIPTIGPPMLAPTH